MRDLDLQQRQRLSDLVVQLAGESPPAFFLDFEQPRRELLQLALGPLHLAMMPLRLTFQVLRVDAGWRAPPTTASSTHSPSISSSRLAALRRAVRELLFALLQSLLVGGLQVQQRVIQVAAPRHDLTLQELELPLVAFIQHRSRERLVTARNSARLLRILRSTSRIRADFAPDGPARRRLRAGLSRAASPGEPPVRAWSE